MSQLVAVIAEENVLSFELSLAGRVLGSAHDSRGRPAYDVRHCSPGGRSVRTTSGFRIAFDDDLSLLQRADLIVLAPSPQHADLTANSPATDVIDAVATATAARIVSVCLGTFPLTATGRLDGETATTHWAAADLLATGFPAVKVDAGALFVPAGDVISSAGAVAGIDMFLHIVRQDLGSAVANTTARACVVPAWREGGQQQYIEGPIPEHPHDHLGATLDWALERLSDPMTVDQFAAHARMSRRSFTRKFRSTMGTSPTAWLTRQRLELAKQLLETTDRTIDDIAHACGLGSGSSLRKHLRAKVGVPPASYRESFHR